MVVIIFLGFFLFYQIILSTQVKPSAIVSNQHGIQELPHELPNDLKKLGNVKKIPNFIKL